MTNASSEHEGENGQSPLEMFGQDMLALAKEGKFDPVIGRDDEIRRVIRILARRTKNNPVLVGEPGTGKTAIVEGLAHRILKGDVPETLNCRLYSLDIGALVAGASFRGQFEQRLKDLLKEVEKMEGKVILFVDEIHLLMGAGKVDGAMDAANLLKPMLARGQLRCIGATTLGEYRKYVEKDAAFERRFQQVFVKEPAVDDTISILRGLKERYEVHHGVRIMDTALVAAAQMSSRYITGRFLPDKAIDLVDEACANVRVQLDSQPEIMDNLERRILQLQIEAEALRKESKRDKESASRLTQVNANLKDLEAQLKPLKEKFEGERKLLDELKVLNRKLDGLRIKLEHAQRDRDTAMAADLQYYAIPAVQDRIAAIKEQMDMEARNADGESFLSDEVGPSEIAETVARWTGIPVQKLSQSETGRLLLLGDRLRTRVVGQDRAVDAVSQAVLRARAGLSRSMGPIGSFLFLGPTGVGKTELAKALATELFDDEKNIVRFDMSEYMESHSVSRLLGAPPGYVGHEEGGRLTEAIRRRPYAVILFDEVEKAHPDVLNVLLQLLDDGRLTDSLGNTVNFSNTLVILTSNLGAHHILEGVEDDGYKNFDHTKQLVMRELEKFFRPEFLNRLDDVILFQALGRVQVLAIGRGMVHQILGQRLADRGIGLNITDDAIEALVDVSFDVSRGARPLRRYIERELGTKVSELLVSGQLGKGMSASVTWGPDNAFHVDVSMPIDED
eukprot:CAMPEP_0184680660 /NCGR_PEP_ID=MMETSP0312-20130426/3559_1 /TAXON_ID=31354 /ORGANISM="Compsopogon coeruleus, Strain SAG 36.94" /LENGTH=732 /DNA_ID=CAMNT_0027130933 /DNA_START=54 /DNA_END=2252 /DNA_ORIENTATION=-